MIRVLLLSLELDREPFSGNGVLATDIKTAKRRRLAGPAAGPLQVEAAGQGGAVGGVPGPRLLAAHRRRRRAVPADPRRGRGLARHARLARDSRGGRPGRLGGCRAVYYNFRVYSASAFGCGDGDFYAEKERLACRHADQIVCLSEKGQGLAGRADGEGRR
ncbi:hypothetical protein THAOC_24280, partial [Thalassiosira oceanica]